MIAPPHITSDFVFKERSVAARYEELCYAKYFSTCFLVGEGLSTDDVGVVRGAVFQDIRPRAGFKPGDSVKKKLGGGLP